MDLRGKEGKRGIIKKRGIRKKEGPKKKKDAGRIYRFGWDYR